MRRYILYSNTGRTDGDFNINDLPGDGGRMDLIARSVISSLWISGEVRSDVEVTVCLNGPPNPPISLKFNGNNIQGLRPNERSIGHWIKKTLNYSDTLVGCEWSNPTNSNIQISKKDISELIPDNQEIYLMDKNGEKIKNVNIKNPVFIVGDHKGIPKKTKDQLKNKSKKISIGPREYFASQTITIINNQIDKKI
ncbi:RNA base methyltransferase family enzyme [Methanonatronarchaeum thermophilum]|uniref:tRNA (pseudouridine(54)-N(1))-methyltransferase n=1 Tax=Methanonatronarchaeum thermophilum TaxID=1927129 RepID=A0A1Y3GH11_9EURY|nr:hypothetical protein [Methanonatronarchaeum thermophilum]OUJ18725.1 RNA base methyltransferase family enzyme [Methanonatronarchaeum thermophilum]